MFVGVVIVQIVFRQPYSYEEDIITIYMETIKNLFSFHKIIFVVFFYVHVLKV